MEVVNLEEIRIAYKKSVCQAIDKLFEHHGLSKANPELLHAKIRQLLIDIGEEKYNEWVKKWGIGEEKFEKEKIEKNLSDIFRLIIENYCLGDVWKRKITLKCHWKGIHNPNDIDEIISDVGFAYVQARENMTPDTNWNKYLSGIIENKINDFIKSRLKQIQTISPYSDGDKKSLDTTPKPVPQADEILYPHDFPGIKQSTFVEALLQCLLKLSRADQYIIKRKYFGKRSLEDIGRELGKDHSYVRRQLEKIYALLKVAITEIVEEKCQ